ncbi:hypothetical protein CI109_104642 [Kwoniella shandongensis]|uniref:Uncharacterized protein n=1 Tax=Kwoniella shandongensis TaxID=1734106 RepID=A0A5M6BVC5_9TREE|nr:uncharacterized protein CI109_004808 [Kwoniella shandongensis]KAA5526808.1 hypothetical protein CI109_004808 [Kwoniella shandongensis]
MSTQTQMQGRFPTTASPLSTLPQITTTITSPPPIPTTIHPVASTDGVPRVPSPTNGRPPSRSRSPTNRSPTSTRPLSPDLPNRDALYLFSNFSSYMRSPNEGSGGIKAEDFKDTIRLLDHARTLTSQPGSNVHVLHLKYRFQGQTNTFRSPYSSGDYQLPLNYRDSVGRLRNPVPQPFSVLHDPVVKIDYMENGVFDPLPAQAVFDHIAKHCQPPPRIIVISYVFSKVIDNHLSSLSSWALTSSPPVYIFSPMETRIREPQPLHIALHHAIPMSMYAWPLEGPSPTSSIGQASPLTFSPTGGEFVKRGRGRVRKRHDGDEDGETGSESPTSPREGHDATSPILLTRHLTSTSDLGQITASPDKPVGAVNATNNKPQRGLRRYPSDPIASLTVITSSPDSPEATNFARPHPLLRSPTATTSASVPPPIDRIPLWQLAPGVGVLHGSTSASIGIKLGDFSAINLVGESGMIDKSEAKKEMKWSEVREMGIRTSPLVPNDGARPPVVAPLPTLLEKPISRPPSTRPTATAIEIASIPEPDQEANDRPLTESPNMLMMTTTTNDAGITHLSPPEIVPRNLIRELSTTESSNQSWPAPISRVPGWRKGRRETMEDTMDELDLRQSGDIPEVDEMSREVQQLQLDSQDEGRARVVDQHDLLALWNNKG